MLTSINTTANANNKKAMMPDTRLVISKITIATANNPKIIRKE